MAKNGTVGVVVMPFTIPASGAVQCQWASSLWWKPTISADGSISTALTQAQTNECFFVGLLPSGSSDTANIAGGLRCEINGVMGKLVSLGGYSVDAYGNLVIDPNAPTTGWFVRETSGEAVNVTAPTYVKAQGRYTTAGKLTALITPSVHIMWTGQNGGYYNYDDNLNYVEGRTWDTHEQERNAYFATELTFLKESYRGAGGQMLIICNKHAMDKAHDIYRLEGRQHFSALCKAEFGNKFIDPLEVFQKLMLEVGHTPTANELACFKVGLQPDFVCSDSASAGSWTPDSSGYPHVGNVHINELGSQAIVNEVLRRLWGLGLIEQKPTLYDVKSLYDEMVQEGKIIV
jgi:hypothetical protein